VQIPPRPPQTNPARSFGISCKGSLSFSEDFVLFIVADEFETFVFGSMFLNELFNFLNRLFKNVELNPSKLLLLDR